MTPPVLRCDPKLFEKDLSGQVMIVTGANSGVGLETTRQLAKQNATVIVACRNPDRAKAAIKDIGSSNALFLVACDLSKFSSVRSFAEEFLSKYDRLDVLVNNAGLVCEQSKTEDGNEIQFGTNHLGHFLLMRLLTPRLIETAEKYGKPSRFVALSSCAAAQVNIFGKTLPMADIFFDDINWEKRKYDTSQAYGQTKLANYLHAMEASKRYPSEKLISVSVHPGWVASNLSQHLTGDNWVGSAFMDLFNRTMMWKGDVITTEYGAQTSLHCVLADDIESGKFYSQIGIYADKECQKGGWPMNLPNPNATDENAAKLWEVSEKMVGL